MLPVIKGVETSTETEIPDSQIISSPKIKVCHYHPLSLHNSPTKQCYEIVVQGDCIYCPKSQKISGAQGPAFLSNYLTLLIIIIIIRRRSSFLPHSLGEFPTAPGVSPDQGSSRLPVACGSHTASSMSGPSGAALTAARVVQAPAEEGP